MTTDKAELRRTVLARRNTIPEDKAALAALAAGQSGPALVERIAQERGVAVGSLTVSAYWPMRGEMDTRPLVVTLAGLGCTVALPVVMGRDQPLEFRVWRPGDGLVTARFGQSEPGPDSAVVTPSVLFVPLAAIDADGNRIGYGGGFYDRTLAKLRSAGPVDAIGLCFQIQVLDAITAEPHDQPLDHVLTEISTMTTGRRETAKGSAA